MREILIRQNTSQKYWLSALNIEFQIRNGGLPGKEYDLVQGHFHWGLDNTKGSEHWVNQVRRQL